MANVATERIWLDTTGLAHKMQFTWGNRGIEINNCPCARTACKPSHLDIQRGKMPENKPSASQLEESNKINSEQKPFSCLMITTSNKAL